jgi:alanyl-tRNA synthetase
MEKQLSEAAEALRTRPENLLQRIEQLQEERAQLEKLVSELRESGGAGEEVVADEEIQLEGAPVKVVAARLKARDADDARAWGDRFIAGNKGVAVLAAEFADGKLTLFSFASDDAISRGLRADAVVRAVAERVGGRGGGRPHLAQAGVPDTSRAGEALEGVMSAVRELVGEGEGA